jgi:hypothetical protein
MIFLKSYSVAHPLLPSAQSQTLPKIHNLKRAEHLLNAHCLLLHAHRHAARHSESGGRNSIWGDRDPLDHHVTKSRAANNLLQLYRESESSPDCRHTAVA